MLSICCKQMFYREQPDNSSSFQTKTKETVNHLSKQRQWLNVWAAALGFKLSNDTFNASLSIIKDQHYKYFYFQVVHSVAFLTCDYSETVMMRFRKTLLTFAITCSPGSRWCFFLKVSMTAHLRFCL